MFDQMITLDDIETAIGRAGPIAATTDFDLNIGLKPTRTKPLRDAAVLVPLIIENDDIRILLTKRSSGMKHHPGQIAFPGGKVDDTDQSITHTALREANEEIGLPYGDSQILGNLPKHETITGFLVQPIVAKIPSNFRPIAETGEVQDVFSVPLNHILNVDNFIVHERIWAGQKRYYYAVPYGPFYIWGATARILRLMAGIIGGDDAHLS
jgi:8-oxo-dGTP pyrophosphatase MutT (NUDIX family)